jgi:hypothetical protein
LLFFVIFLTHFGIELLHERGKVCKVLIEFKLFYRFGDETEDGWIGKLCEVKVKLLSRKIVGGSFQEN